MGLSLQTSQHILCKGGGVRPTRERLTKQNRFTNEHQGCLSQNTNLRHVDDDDDVVVLNIENDASSDEFIIGAEQRF